MRTHVCVCEIEMIEIKMDPNTFVFFFCCQWRETYANFSWQLSALLIAHSIAENKFDDNIDDDGEAEIKFETVHININATTNENIIFVFRPEITTDSSYTQKIGCLLLLLLEKQQVKTKLFAGARTIQSWSANL